MNILLVDDDRIKRKTIVTPIRRNRPETNIRYFENLRDAEYFIDKNHNYTDLLILDWCFPETSYERPKAATGKKMLDYIKEKGYNINTVMCSSDILNIEELQEEYPFIIGSLIYGTCNPYEALYNIYIDYWKKISDRKSSPVGISTGSPVKKLVNPDVK